MRWTCRLILVALLALGGPWALGHASADEEPVAEQGALEQGLAALRVRLESKLLEAQLLAQAGRVEEALAATREVEPLYREGLAELRRLVADQALPPASGRTDPPAVEADEEDAEPRMPPGITPDPPFFGDPPSPGAFPGRRARHADDTASTPPGESLRDDAVLHALRWLAAHQSEDGRWEAEGFGRWCHGKANPWPAPDGSGKPVHDVGVTGLALCAFLGAGYTNRGDHEFARVVRKGLAYLKNVQDPEGCFGPRSTQHYVYNHAAAALAMVEAYGMTESNIYKGAAQKALDFIALARNPYFVWRYGVKPGDNDSSVTGWMMMALKSARLVNEDATRRGKQEPLRIEEAAFDGIRAWFDKMTDPESGRVGYVSRGSGPARPMEVVDRFPAAKSESMTAVGMLARIFMGDNPRKDPIIKKGADLTGKLVPTWNTSDGSIDMSYWYYATLAIYQVGGDDWNRWEKGMNDSVVANQRMDGNYCGFKGSWDPVDPWGPDGGRVYSTAMMALCCEVTRRYERVASTK
jgi:hypothetical protein